MHDLLADLRYAARQLLRHPAFALSAVLSLALGLGVNVTVFGLADAMLLRKPQVEAPDRLVRLYVNSHSPFRWNDYQRLKADRSVFSHVLVETMLPVSLGDANGGAEPALARAAVVSGDYFAALGLEPALGQLADAAREDVPSAVPRIVLNHAYWTSRFAADPAIVGRTVRVNDRAFEVAGVAPAHFTTAQVLWTPDLYVAISESPTLIGAGPESFGGSLYTTARLADGVSMDAANARLAQMHAEAAALDSARYARTSWRAASAIGVTEEMRGPVTVVSAFLLVVALIVLLVACSNVGNLLLARNAGRARELSVRVALGAGRWRLIRQLLVESGLIAVVSVVAAFLLSRWSIALLATFIPPEAGMTLDARLNPTVLGFGLLLVVLVLLVAGLLPALQGTRRDLTAGLREGAAGSGRRGGRLRRVFLGMQVTASTVLVACAALFLHSLGNAGEIDAGFDTAGILDARMDLGRQRDAAATNTLVTQLSQRVRDLPGVTAVTSATIAPLTFENSEAGIWIEGQDQQDATYTYFNAVGAGYFGAMRMPLVTGRDFAETDGLAAPGVAVVNERFAERFWPGENAVGKRLSTESATGPWIEVVGVSRMIKYNSLAEQAPSYLYVPVAQSGTRNLILHVVTAPGVPIDEVGRSIVRAAREVDPTLPPPHVNSLAAEQQVMMLPSRLGAALTGVFGGLALLLASVGIFGVAAFDVSQRTRELGIRSALGAPARTLLRLVLRETLQTVAIGAGAGLLLALGAARLLQSQLYGVGFADPLTFIVTPVVLVVVAGLATLVPARRALAVDPAVALRED